MDYSEPGFIEKRLPHRPPFLWLDRVVELSNDFIKAEKLIPADLEIFKGHYPDYPIMPGVLLCEAVFQAGALLISERSQVNLKQETGLDQAVPVLTRILGAKFKREVKPGDQLEISATFKEQVGPAWFLKGNVKVAGKIAVQVEFACIRKS